MLAAVAKGGHQSGSKIGIISSLLTANAKPLDLISGLCDEEGSSRCCGGNLDREDGLDILK